MWYVTRKMRKPTELSNPSRCAGPPQVIYNPSSIARQPISMPKAEITHSEAMTKEIYFLEYRWWLWIHSVEEQVSNTVHLILISVYDLR